MSTHPTKWHGPFVPDRDTWDDEAARRASTRRSQYHHEAPADLTPDMYDDPYMEFADGGDDVLLAREEAGFYDEDAS